MAVGQYDWSTIVKVQLLYNFIISALYGMGTERHFGDIQRLIKQEVETCFFFNSAKNIGLIQLNCITL